MTNLILKLLDLLLGGLISKYKNQKRIKDEFETLKRKILYVGIINELPCLLKELRDFLIENNLIKKNGFNKFHSDWLNDPIVIQGIQAVNVFSKKQTMELNSELKQLKL